MAPSIDTSLRAAPDREFRPLDFTARIRLVCVDMVARLPELAHVDMCRVAVAFSQARSP
jgi:hypothetical protein